MILVKETGGLGQSFGWCKSGCKTILGLGCLNKAAVAQCQLVKDDGGCAPNAPILPMQNGHFAAAVGMHFLCVGCGL